MNPLMNMNGKVSAQQDFTHLMPWMHDICPAEGGGTLVSSNFNEFPYAEKLVKSFWDRAENGSIRTSFCNETSCYAQTYM